MEVPPADKISLGITKLLAWYNDDLKLFKTKQETNHQKTPSPPMELAVWIAVTSVPLSKTEVNLTCPFSHLHL